MKTNIIDKMIGQIVKDIDGKKDENSMIFTFEDGRQFGFWHEQDCCEDVSINDIIGDLSDLIGSPIIEAEEVSSNDVGDLIEENEEVQTSYQYDSITWTFYRFSTKKGTVTVRWFGTSNGYYSEEVTFGFLPDQIN